MPFVVEIPVPWFALMGLLPARNAAAPPSELRKRLLRGIGGMLSLHEG